MKNTLLLLFSVVTLALAGCAIGPNYKRPTVDVPGDFRFAAYQSTNSFADLPWWEVFKDPTLLRLIREAVTNNYDLRQAVDRVEQARNIAVVARAPLFPQIGCGGGVGRGRNALFNSSFPLMGATESSAQVNLNAFWEVDLWGRIRRMSEAARAEYLAMDNARRGVTIALVSEVAIAYFQLLQFDEELAIQRAATNAFAGSYQLFADRLNNGAASKLETDRAAAARANAASIVPLLEVTAGNAAPPHCEHSEVAGPQCGRSFQGFPACQSPHRVNKTDLRFSGNTIETFASYFFLKL